MKIKSELETKRLKLRPWRIEDASALYKYASDPRVGPIAGWPIHTDIEFSKQIIRDVFSADGIYAIVPKGQEEPIGCIGLLIGKSSDFGIGQDEGEIAYWIGVPYWGQGLIPEAMRELMRYSFNELGLKSLWCGYFEGNEKSARAQEKCGFKYHSTNIDKPWPLMGDIRTEIITCISKDEWLNQISLSE
ncbi:GNAT family N-acetyltransferase [Romboutsia sp. CE17]|uniref:GNAT family N-acetyltransferase n=1 Tax=Romboutsia sp. CE17 TaxID=2724150 RepID=UPI001442AE20|nr:GNAT family N-acetyltransferase [Romboutsia sp. CE17]QJA07536.1 GNAT family N-acetyltransferase [Romboutsia sp. CE17]